MLELIALKGARWVLRGGGGSNVTSLPDKPTATAILRLYTGKV